MVSGDDEQVEDDEEEVDDEEEAESQDDVGHHLEIEDPDEEGSEEE